MEKLDNLAKQPFFAMNASDGVEFVLKGEVDGKPVSLKNMSFSSFNRFNQQAAEFVSAGGNIRDLEETRFSIHEGSYKLIVNPSPLLLGEVLDDLENIRNRNFDKVNPKRKKIISEWQRDVLKGQIISVYPKGNIDRALVIDRDHQPYEEHADEWVDVETYLLGEIMNMGGTNKANVHIRLKGQSKTLLVDAPHALLADEEENHLYKDRVLHVRAKQHLRTRELTDLKLIGIQAEKPAMDESFEKFVERGTEAWADAPDAAEWVRELRGGSLE